MSASSATLAAARPRHGRRDGFALAFVVGAVAALVVMVPQAWSVWRRDTFLDPDDALRIVQIRDYLAGQPWFDLVPHRLSPDHPFAMHWSRLVDAPLALLQRVLDLGLPVGLAERAMRIVAPMLFFGAALFAMLRLTARLVGTRGLVPAALLFAFAAEPMTNFLPGHIHHHGLQAALLLLATAALVESIGRAAEARFAILSGALAMLSLGVGLQNLPFVVGLVSASLLLWVWNGAARGRQLAAFGLGLLAAVPVFCLDVPPGQYRDGAIDAFSAVHLVAACATALLCVILAALRLPSVAARLGAAAVGAGLVLGIVVCCFPQALRDPMANVDPLLRDAWLSGVGEALPLGRLIALSWPQGMALLLTLGCGLGATAFATAAATPSERGGWAVLLGLGAIGFLGALWQIRVAASTLTLLLPGIAWLVLKVFDRAARRPRVAAVFLAILGGAFGNGAGWNAVALPLARLGRGTGAPALDPKACLDPANYVALAALPPGLVLSTIDPGSTVLAYTHHTVLAAPYHRNTYGNRVALLALPAPADVAHGIIAQAGVRYLVLCRASNETAETVLQHPDSLSAALMAGHVPAWLVPLSDPSALFQIYRVL